MVADGEPMLFAGGAKGSITGCLVSNPGHCGITAGPESTVSVTGTIVTGSRYHGLRCTGGELNAENNLVIANKNRGFYLGNKPARGTIRFSTGWYTTEAEIDRTTA